MNTTHTQKHTPGKLTVCWPHDNKPVGQETHAGLMIDAEGGQQIVKCSKSLTEANAARLAHCWNCHDELVEALQECFEVLELPEPTPDQFGTCYTATQRSGTAAKAMLKARAALSRAQGQTRGRAPRSHPGPKPGLSRLYR